MKKPLLTLLTLLLLLPLAAGCAGVRQTGETYTAHAESFHLFGITIPSSDHDRAVRNVPAEARIITMRSSPSDWTSLIGILTNIIGISGTEITYTLPDAHSGSSAK